MRIAFIGQGQVGAPLADRLQRADHAVTLAARDPASARVQALRARNPALQVAPPAVAVAAADLVFLATPFAANEAAVRPLAAELAGKVLVDCTNPVGPGLTHALGSASSGSAQLQRWLPATRVVKSFSIYGYENLEAEPFPGAPLRPLMMVAGDDADARRAVATLAADLGFEPLDVGGIVQALPMEHLTLLWIRLVRAGGRSPHLAWSLLDRGAP